MAKRTRIGWVIYVLTDPREPEIVRYVGWATDARERLRVHLAVVKTDRSYCANWKRFVLRDGVTPVMTIIETGEGDGWQAAEKRWIAHYRALPGSRLTNLTEGGDGAPGCVRSTGTRAKIGAANKGKKLSEETKTKLREAQLGREPTPETRAKMSEAQTGRKKPPEVVAKSAEFWLGRKHSEEARAKIHVSHEGLNPAHPKRDPVRSEESRGKTRVALLEHYAEMGGGRKLSAATKEKIRASMKAYRTSNSGSLVDPQLPPAVDAT